MGVILPFKPKLSFPIGKAFQIGDQRNGPQRGTWFYRSTHDGEVNGPYHSKLEAEAAIERDFAIQPFQDQYRKWWWEEPKNSNMHGPFDRLQEAEADLLSYLNRADNG